MNNNRPRLLLRCGLWRRRGWRHLRRARLRPIANFSVRVFSFVRRRWSFWNHQLLRTCLSLFSAESPHSLTPLLSVRYLRRSGWLPKYRLAPLLMYRLALLLFRQLSRTSSGAMGMKVDIVVATLSQFRRLHSRSIRFTKAQAPQGSTLCVWVTNYRHLSEVFDYRRPTIKEDGLTEGARCCNSWSMFVVNQPAQPADPLHTWASPAGT